MYWYSIDGKRAASLEEAPLPPAGEGVPELFLVRGDPVSRPAVWHVTDPRQLTAERGRSCRRPSPPPRPAGSPASTSSTPAGGGPWTLPSTGPGKGGSTCWRWETWAALC